MNPEKTNFLLRALRWFDPRGRTIGSYAFILNRITALGLTLYLFLHLVVLGQLSQGPTGYNAFLETIHNPVYIFAELLVVAAVFIHGLNGVRIILTSFGIGVPQQRQQFVVLMVIALIAILYFGVRMFGAA